MLCNSGEEHFEKQEFTESIDEYSKALALKGLTNSYVYDLLSKRCFAYVCYYESTRDVNDLPILTTRPSIHKDIRYRALMDAMQCLELRPICWKSYYTMGCVYNALNRFQKAIVYFDRALAFDPNNSVVIYSRDFSTSQKAMKHVLVSANHQLNEYLYHYTSSEGSQKIISCGYIKPSKREPIAGARYGSGVYLTSIPPTEGIEKIIANNYGNDGNRAKNKKKVKYFFKFNACDVPHVEKLEGNRDLFISPKFGIILPNVRFEFGLTANNAVIMDHNKYMEENYCEINEEHKQIFKRVKETLVRNEFYFNDLVFSQIQELDQ